MDADHGQKVLVAEEKDLLGFSKKELKRCCFFLSRDRQSFNRLVRNTVVSDFSLFITVNSAPSIGEHTEAY